MSVLDTLVADMNNQVDWYVTGPDEGECTAVPHEWEQRLGLPIVYGNAIDTFDNAPDDQYEKELNSPSGVPRPGAIVVWGEYAPYGISGQWGHTAVALGGCDTNTLVIMEQNWGERIVRIHSRDYGGVKGWFYPRVLEDHPAPAPPPPPEPNPPQQTPPPPPPLPDPPPPEVVAPAPPEQEAPITTTSNVTAPAINKGESIVQTLAPHPKVTAAAVCGVLAAVVLVVLQNGGTYIPQGWAGLLSVVAAILGGYAKKS